MLFSIGFGVLYAVYPMVTDYSGLLVCVFVTVFMTSQVHTLRIPFAISVTGTKNKKNLLNKTYNSIFRHLTGNRTNYWR